MKPSLVRLFIWSAGALFFITGMAKLVSAIGSADVLRMRDPILAIPFRYLFVLAGGLELAIAFFCVFGRRMELQVGSIAWLATVFLVYRLGLWLIDYHKGCSCLGNLMEVLHISQEMAGQIMRGVLVYLLVGSYVLLVWLLWHRRNISSISSSVRTTSTIA